jgi:hypothetical protein
VNKEASTLQSVIDPSDTVQSKKLARSSLILGFINFIWPVLLFFSYGPASMQKRVYLGGDAWRYSSAPGNRVYQVILLASLIAVVVLGIIGLTLGVRAVLKTRRSPSLYSSKWQAIIGIILNFIVMMGTILLLLFLMSSTCC